MFHEGSVTILIIFLGTKYKQQIICAFFILIWLINLILKHLYFFISCNMKFNLLAVSIFRSREVASRRRLWINRIFTNSSGKASVLSFKMCYFLNNKMIFILRD